MRDQPHSSACSCSCSSLLFLWAGVGRVAGVAHDGYDGRATLSEVWVSVTEEMLLSIACVNM